MTEKRVLSGEKPLVLVADDDRDICELVEMKLLQSNYRVVTVNDGESALMEIIKISPDFVLLDIMMPGLTGTEVLSRMRSTDGCTDIPVMLFSAKSQEFDLDSVLEMGAVDYITKPFSPRELVQRIAEAIGRVYGSG